MLEYLISRGDKRALSAYMYKYGLYMQLVSLPGIVYALAMRICIVMFQKSSRWMPKAQAIPRLDQPNLAVLGQNQGIHKSCSFSLRVLPTRFRKIIYLSPRYTLFPESFSSRLTQNWWSYIFFEIWHFSPF